jgi:predicted dienelactone hydrolase
MTAGCREFDLDGMRVLAMYPASAPEAPVSFGPYQVDVAMNAPVSPGPHPLVVISHGTGGSHLLYRTLAQHLARNGFVVAMPEHPRNNRNDDSLAHTKEILANRPQHLHTVIEHAFATWDLTSVAIVGHSLAGTPGSRSRAAGRTRPAANRNPLRCRRMNGLRRWCCWPRPRPGTCWKARWRT